MAPSSTPSDASWRSEVVLAAREARQAAIDRWRGAAGTVVAVALAVPGIEKAPPGAAGLMAWAVAVLGRELPGARRLSATWDALGPFELWSAPGAAAEVKRRCITVEGAAPAARLVDLDVYSPEGLQVDRASLALPARACLCCAEPARDCIRAGRHRPEDVVARAHRLLADFRP
jgi:holo-ACP synthase CitX